MRRALLALAVLAATLGAPITVADAGAWTDGVCPDPSGVTVVIDFQELGGGVHVRCAPQPVTSGFSALQQAGIDYTTTARFPGFVCRIGGRPETDPCQTASPATAYWSYWLAARGGQWCYSNWGAGNRTPPPGSVEGWSFSLQRSASTAPPPRLGVPAALPGTAPGALAGNDCDTGAAAPRPAPGGPSPAAPPGPAETTPPAPGPAPVAGGGAPAGSHGAGGPAGPNHDDRGRTPGVGDPAPSSTTAAPAVEAPAAQVEAAGAEAGNAATEDDATTDDPLRTSGIAVADEETAAVDLSGDGRDPGTPVGVIIALALVAALGGGSYFIRRRRGAADPA